MMPLYEYICIKGHITEEFSTSYSVTEIICSCGERATRLISRKGTFIMDPEDRGGHV